MTDENRPLQKLLGVIGIGLSWGVAYAAVFATIALIIGLTRPQDIDPGESLPRITGIGFVVGFVSGTIYGLILSFAENRKPISDVGLMRVAIWGMLGAAAWPLLTPLPDEMVMMLCPIGAICALTALAIARRTGRQGAEQSPFVRSIGHLLASPLKAACA